MKQYFINRLEELGYKAKFVASEHAKEIIEEIDNRYKDNELYSKIYNSYLQFNTDNIKGKGSLLIVSVKLPIINLTFNWRNKEIPVVIPPGYIGSDIVNKFNIEIKALFNEKNYSLSKCKLPLKLLASRSKLGVYGRNNVIYVKGFGSFHMLTCFYTDVPCVEDTFEVPSIAEECRNCKICISSCPSGALSNESFMVNTKRCITFPNETEGTFEDWIDPSWHNALMGCFHCLGNCPMNKPYLSNTRAYPAFTEEETVAFYMAEPFETLALGTQEKVKAIELDEIYGIFTRNLKVLLDKLS